MSRADGRSTTTGLRDNAAAAAELLPQRPLDAVEQQLHLARGRSARSLLRGWGRQCSPEPRSRGSA